MNRSTRHVATLSCLSFLFLLRGTVGCSDTESTGTAPLTSPSSSSSVRCEAPAPPPDALLTLGKHGDVFLVPGGRAISPAGATVETGGFPAQILPHPSLPVAYVANTGHRIRAVQVIDKNSATVLQRIDRAGAFLGLALSPDGKRLYASGGSSEMVEVYDIGADGSLTAAAQIALDGYPAGIVLSPDGTQLWVAQFVGKSVSVVDTTTLAISKTLVLDDAPFGIVHIPSRNELYTTGFRGGLVRVIDATNLSAVAGVDVGKNPEGIVASPDGKHVFVTVSDADTIVSIDTATRAVSSSLGIGDPLDVDFVLANPSASSSPTGLDISPDGKKLYVARAGANSVAVVDVESFALEGAIPVGWYPTAVALSGTTLLVANGKGIGTGPNPDDDNVRGKMVGTVSSISLPEIDLQKSTAKVAENERRPDVVYPFVCEGSFPIPTKPGADTPIQHVVLIVRENKSYDSDLGDMETGNGDPSLVMFGESITPNLHALARKYTSHDNYYANSEASVQGHLWLTSSFVNDYTERTWIEDYNGHGNFSLDAGLALGTPGFGTLPIHLMKHDVSFSMHGEVVASTGKIDGKDVFDHVDVGFPGLFYDNKIHDSEKATHVAEVLLGDEFAGPEFPSFVYVLLPNDHNFGTSPGALTPEAMVNENDWATGLLIDKISHSKFWDSTAIFVVEDDPSDSFDHVDAHRSPCVVVSPYAKRGHVSSVNTSMSSLIRTIEMILGVPPLTRSEAFATPMWDAFTSIPDFTPYDAIPRTVPDSTNPENAPAAKQSKRLDFSGPDRTEGLGEILWYYRKGTPHPGSWLDVELNASASASKSGRHGVDDDDDDDRDSHEPALTSPLHYDLDDEDEIERRERDAYDLEIARFQRWLLENPAAQEKVRRAQARSREKRNTSVAK